MSVTDIAKVSALYNTDPFLQAANASLPLRNDLNHVQDFARFDENQNNRKYREMIANSINYTGYQKANEAERMRLGRENFDQQMALNAVDKKTGQIRNAADVAADLLRNGVLQSHYGALAARDAAQTGARGIAANLAAIGDTAGAAGYGNASGMFGAKTIDPRSYDPAYLGGLFALQNPATVNTRQYNHSVVSDNRSYEEKVRDAGYARQDEAAKAAQVGAIEIAKANAAAGSEKRDVDIIQEGYKLFTNKDTGEINRDGLSQYLNAFGVGSKASPAVQSVAHANPFALAAGQVASPAHAGNQTHQVTSQQVEANTAQSIDPSVRLQQEIAGINRNLALAKSKGLTGSVNALNTILSVKMDALSQMQNPVRSSSPADYQRQPSYGW